MHWLPENNCCEEWNKNGDKLAIIGVIQFHSPNLLFKNITHVSWLPLLTLTYLHFGRSVMNHSPAAG